MHRFRIVLSAGCPKEFMGAFMGKTEVRLEVSSTNVPTLIWDTTTTHRLLCLLSLLARTQPPEEGQPPFDSTLRVRVCWGRAALWQHTRNSGTVRRKRT